MPGMSVGGLISGLDTNSIIAQLTALEQAKVTREVQKKSNAQATLDKFKELQTRLGNVASKASALELPSRFNVFKTSSSYEDYASISGKEGASAGKYELRINQLATTQKVASNSFSAINTPIGPTGGTTLTLSTSEAAKKADSTKKSVEVKIGASDTLKDVVNKINAAEGAGVKASIMTMANGENRLILTAVDSGTNGFSIKDSTGSNWLSEIGIIRNDTQKATSGNALLTLDGKAATGETTFDQLNTVLARNNLSQGDVLGIYLPTNKGDGTGGWVTFDLYKYKEDNDGNLIMGSDGKPIVEEIKTMDAVLGEINSALGASGANFTAKLNNSGEIVIEGDLTSDGNFGGSSLGDVKIQIIGLKSYNGETKEDIADLLNDDVLTAFEKNALFNVKKDMGSFTERNVFNEVISEGQNAVYTIDGMAVSSQTNSDEKTISGTVFTLKKITPESMEDIKLSIDLDLDGLVGKITEFMDEFNALLKFIDDNSKAFIKEETDEITGKKTSKREIGAFTGDSGISSLRENLKRMLTGTINEITGVDKVQIGTVQDGPDAGKPIYGPANGYSTVYSSAARIGFLTEKDGTVSVDRAKLTKALEADYEGVRKLFTANNFSNTTGFSVGRFTKDSKSGVYEIRASGTPGEAEVWYNGKKLEGISRTLDHGRDKILTTKDGLSFEIPDGWDGSPAKVTFVRGIANQISNFFETSRALTLTTSDGRIVPGYFKQSENTYQARIDAIEKRIDQLQMRVDNYNARLVKQFSALERSMGTLQSQSANMMSALSTLTMRR